jgi:hypothetical protein
LIKHFVFEHFDTARNAGVRSSALTHDVRVPSGLCARVFVFYILILKLSEVLNTPQGSAQKKLGKNKVMDFYVKQAHE